MTRAKYSTFHIFILFRRADIINSFCHLDLIWQSWVWLDFDWQNWIKVVNISSVLVHTKELIAIWKLLLLSGKWRYIQKTYLCLKKRRNKNTGFFYLKWRGFCSSNFVQSRISCFSQQSYPALFIFLSLYFGCKQTKQKRTEVKRKVRTLNIFQKTQNSTDQKWNQIVENVRQSISHILYSNVIKASYSHSDTFNELFVPWYFIWLSNLLQKLITEGPPKIFFNVTFWRNFHKTVWFFSAWRRR